MLKGVVQHKTVREFHADPTALIRDAILGVKVGEDERPGMIFDEVNFRLKDIEVLEVKIGDANIAKLLLDQQHHIVTSDIALDRLKKTLEVEHVEQEIARRRADALAETAVHTHKLQLETIKRSLEGAAAQLAAEREELDAKREVQALRDTLENDIQAQELARTRRETEVILEKEKAVTTIELEKVEAQTEATVARYKAAEGPLAEAIQLLGNQDVVAKVAQAISAQRLFGGENAADVLSNLFKGTGVGSFFAKALEANGTNGKQPSGAAALK